MICHHCKQEIGSAAACPYCGAIVLKEPQPHHLPVGSRIAGRYTIEGVLGEGGFGITYLGRYDMLGLTIAVKEYFPHGFAYRNTTESTEVFVRSGDTQDYFEHGRERFLKEAQTLAKFQSERGVVSVTDFVKENNTAYLIMEYIEGITLMQYLKQHGVMDAKETFETLEPVMKTLEKIHAAGVIHRDISPDNIMRLNSGQLKLMDFGAAREYIDENESMSVVLKQGYAPLEQYRRKGDQGPWTDVYALCATIYHCITGKRPVDVLDRVMEDTLKKPSELGVKIAPSYEKLLMYGLAIRREDRCQSMTELLRLLDEAKREDARAVETDPNATMLADEYTEPDPDMTMLADEESVQATTADEKRPGSHEAPIPEKRVKNDRSHQNNQNRSVEFLFGANDQPPVEEAPKKKKRVLLAPGIVIGALVLVIFVVVMGIAVKKQNEWKNLTDISAGSSHTVGAKKNGAVITAGHKRGNELEVSEWKDITAVAAGEDFTLGLDQNGKVIMAGTSTFWKEKVDTWTDIDAIAASRDHAIGLKKDGTVIAIGSESNGECDVDSWTDIIAVSTSVYHTVGLKKDGTVVATGSNSNGQCDVDSWEDIIAVAAGRDHTVGIKKDGSVVAVGKNSDGQCEVGKWQDITAISAGERHTIGVKKDGSVVAVGCNDHGECDVSGWEDIAKVSAGSSFTVAIDQNGTAFAAGLNDVGQCDLDK